MTGNHYVGGLAGYIVILSTISNCYSTGTVTRTGNQYGGFAGWVNNATVSNSFWDTQTSGQGSSPGGTGKTTAEMKTASTFYDADWDFEEDGNGNDDGTNGGASGNGTDNYWDMDQDGNNYPVLSWQDGAIVLVTDLTDPSAPTALIATPGNTQVNLVWTANSESDLASYKVYGGTSSTPTTLVATISSGTETSTVTSLTNGTLYYYRISAVDNTGNESSKTSDVSSLSHDPSGNYSLSFDGVNDYVNVGDMLSQGSYTKVAWVNRATGNVSNNIISGNTGHAFWAPSSYDYKLSAGHNGVWNSVQDGEALTIGEWHFVAITYDPNVASGTMKLYKNGNQIDNATGIAVQDESTITYIGRYSNGNNFKGSIDEVGIWDEALTSAEITALYNSGMPLDASSNSAD